ncbi:MAG TPA: glycosyltransferase family 39 protein, partial [Verrucomicrobiae bacterium]|nr:glycosyltransferase family 39 protein [Verrucomicrobiae bacterium]
MNNVFEILKRRAGWVLAAITIVALLPFLFKAFNIDDPLFLWSAIQIQSHPLDPFGFRVEWDWRAAPFWLVTENPPLQCYYLALAAKIVGWSEPALHGACLLPAVLAILGTFRLAKHFCKNPVLAALAALFTPAFLVSGTTVMCDVPMLACWVWAAVFWVEGSDENDYRKLLAAGVLMALAELTKYYAFTLMPLLAAYSAASRHPVRRWAAFLLIPLAALIAWQIFQQYRYGYSPLARAIDFVHLSKQTRTFSPDTAMLNGLSFAGGSMAVILFLAPALWTRRNAIAFAAAALVIAGFIAADAGLLRHYPLLQGGTRLSAQIQLVLWATVGLSLPAIAIADLWRQRDPKSLMLALWVMGT